MSQCRRQLERAKRALSRHNPEAALRALEEALNVCPVEEHEDLAHVFYYLGVTLLRLQRCSAAVRSFRAAARLRKRACYSRRMLERFGNDYGMVRQSTPELDDWKAFYSIHLQRYLHSKNSPRITTAAEGDMIRDLIHDYWRALVAKGLLAGRCAEDKLSLFRSVDIVFPVILPPDPSVQGKTIAVNFATKTRISADDRCRCGSGIPYRMCCGRTRSAEELVPGTF